MDGSIKKLKEKTEEVVKSFDGKHYKYGIIKNKGSWYGNPGDLVTIRSVHEGEDKKTCLGILVGQEFRTSSENPVEPLPRTGNPAIYVFELNGIRCGYESWWRKIPEEDIETLTLNELLEKYKITDNVIDGTIFEYIARAIAVADIFEKNMRKEDDVVGRSAPTENDRSYE